MNYIEEKTLFYIGFWFWFYFLVWNDSNSLTLKQKKWNFSELIYFASATSQPHRKLFPSLVEFYNVMHNFAINFYFWFWFSFLFLIFNFKLKRLVRIVSWLNISCFFFLVILLTHVFFFNRSQFKVCLPFPKTFRSKPYFIGLLVDLMFYKRLHCLTRIIPANLLI